jgi:hypothetical protein
MADTNIPDSPEIDTDSQGALGESLDGNADEQGVAETTRTEDQPDAAKPENQPAGTQTQQSPQPPSKFKRFRKRFSIYFLLFIFLLLLAAIIMLIAYQQNRHATNSNDLKTQELSASALQRLASGDVSVGNNKTILKVQSSTIFGGQVLVKQSLEVAGNLRIGGTTALNDLTAAGTSQFGQVSINKNLSVAGNTALQGATVAKSLQVGGGGTFSGPLSAPQITTGSLQLNGNLVLTHHIQVGGSRPGGSRGSAVGSGGSVSVSGSDTAGAVNINTGSGTSAGCFVTVTFATRYNSTPNVLITPVGSSAGSLSYYINRSTTNFSICVASPAPTGRSFGFDYFVVE